MTDPHVQIDDSKLAMRVSRRSIYINLLLTVFKLAAGLIARSSAMVPTSSAVSWTPVMATARGPRAASPDSSR